MLFIIGLVLGGIMVVFVLQNIIPVTVNFFAWEFSGSLSVILVLAIVAGMLVSFLLSLPEMIRKEFNVSRLKKDNKKLQGELDEHKQKLTEAHDKIVEVNNDPLIIEKTEKTTIIETEQK